MSFAAKGDSANWQGAARASYRRLDRAEFPSNHPVYRMADYFDATVARRGVFRKGDFSPSEVPKVLPWLQIFEETAPGAFLYRLVGSGVDELVGFSNTGQMLGESLPDDILNQRLREIEECRRDRSPIFSSSVLPFKGRDFIAVIRGVFPCDGDESRFVFMPVAPYKL